jgi:plasmid stabilization system protein ParE
VKRPTILLLPQAEAEIHEAMHWYLERSALAANAFKAELISAIDSLADHPARWPANEEGVRQQVLRRFPYTLHYDFDELTVTVLAVAHHRRKPGYWRPG